MVLTMVYNTQKYGGLGLFPSSGILENTTFRKLDLFPSSGEGGGETPTQLGPLERANRYNREIIGNSVLCWVRPNTIITRKPGQQC
jgi:hypothetical protein